MAKRLVLAALLAVAAAFLAACQVEEEGGGPDATLMPDASATVAPTAPDATPTQALGTPTPVNSDPEKAQQALDRGTSQIWWNNDGVVQVEIAPGDEADFQPFLDGLKKALNE